MLKHLRLLNPFVPIATEAEARTAARAGAVGAYIGAIQAGVGAVTIAVTASTLADAMRRSMIATIPTDMDPDRIVMTMKAIPDMIVGMAVLSAGVAIACAVLGAIQWRKLTRLIPLLLLLFAVFGIASTLKARLTMSPEALPDIGIPVWRSALNWAASMAKVLLLIVGFRGGSVLAALRKAPVAATA